MPIIFIGCIRWQGVDACAVHAGRAQEKADAALKKGPNVLEVAELLDIEVVTETPDLKIAE